MSIQNLKINRENLKVRKKIQAISVNIGRLDNTQMSFHILPDRYSQDQTVIVDNKLLFKNPRKRMR